MGIWVEIGYLRDAIYWLPIQSITIMLMAAKLIYSAGSSIPTFKYAPIPLTPHGDIT